MTEQEFPMVDVLRVKALSEYRLWLRFSDGHEGVCDLKTLVFSGGPMFEPLRDATFFSRVFVEMGSPTWPNGLDLDAIKIYMELRAAGLLDRAAA
ncbi:MAG: DUF2442 domain-containing protein [Mesorhizobium sp.]|nr:DUF2442 domain-containing protein [Mesorhizobium sp.]